MIKDNILDKKKKEKKFSLVFVVKGEKVLLGRKKRGFGENKYNGFGGKVEPNETLKEASSRELFEECELKVKPDDLDHYGTIYFEFIGMEKKKVDYEDKILVVSIFKTEKFVGVPKETEEMEPKWFEIEDLPLEKMWLDDAHWLPTVLGSKNTKPKRIEAYFLFEGHDKIVKKVVNTKK